MKKSVPELRNTKFKLSEIIPFGLLLFALIMGGCTRSLAQIEPCNQNSEELLILTCGIEKTPTGFVLISQNTEVVSNKNNPLPVPDQDEDMKEEIRIEIKCGSDTTLVQARTAYFHTQQNGKIIAYLSYYILYDASFQSGVLYATSPNEAEIGTVDLSNPKKF